MADQIGLPQLFRVEDVARQLGVSTRTVRRLIKRGALNAHRIGTNLRVDATCVTALLAATSAKGIQHVTLIDEQRLDENSNAVRYKAYEEKGRGFIVRYYAADGKRHSHRIERNQNGTPHDMQEAEQYAATWIAANVQTGSRKRARRPRSLFGPTFEAVANEWLTGRLHARFPDHVVLKKSASDDAARLKRYVFPIIGDEPICAFEGEYGIDLVQRVAAALPTDEKQMSSATRRHILQVIHRVLALAVFPLRLLKQNPLPRGFVPKAKSRRAKSYLYPSEDALLMSCMKIPLVERLFYGLLAREGLRVAEMLSLIWSDLELEEGVVNLDENKTDDPRAWALQPDVSEALRRWRILLGKKSPPTRRILTDSSGATIDPYEAARALRAHLQTAGVTRVQLFERGESRIPIRAHDLRASFVTVNLALGKTEAWITDRTGHQSSQMIYAYKRQARTHAELNLGAFHPLHEALPELRALGSVADPNLIPN